MAEVAARRVAVDRASAAGAANTASIHQRRSSTTLAITGQPIVGNAYTDFHLRSQEGEAFNVMTQHPFTAEGCQLIDLVEVKLPV